MNTLTVKFTVSESYNIMIILQNVQCCQLEAPELSYNESEMSEKSVYFGNLGIPEVQETTQQVPCGIHSIFDPDQQVPNFMRAIYLKVNEYSDWDTGLSHALSLRRLASLLNVNSHSQVRRGIKWLIEHGWLVVKGKRKSDGAYFYQVVHHKCELGEIPVDKDGRPQKCAVPKGQGSPSQLIEQGKITWKIFVDWTVRKVHSCWVSGVVSMTVRYATKLMKMTTKTISENAKKMTELGLLEKLSKPFRLSEYQMYPSPYPERRKRKAEYRRKRPMKFIEGFYYSFNERWRLHRDTLMIQMRDAGSWRNSSEYELKRINSAIYKDFMDFTQILIQFHRLGDTLKTGQKMTNLPASRG